MEWRFEDFTDANYRRLLKLAGQSWRFVGYDQLDQPGRLCLWRHDVDFSMHRAAKMAAMEAEEGVFATYFVLLRGNFYNLLEAPVTRLLRRIAAQGHAIGLHFDPTQYEDLTPRTLEEKVGWEAALLADLAEAPVRSMCYHVPDRLGTIDVGADQVAGLTNAFGRRIRESFRYCSDSNGYWRFDRLSDILEAGKDDRLHVLTHPSLWTPEAMAPRQRIARCIHGRAMAQARDYDAILKDSGRDNLRDADGRLARLFEIDPDLCLLIEDLLQRGRADLAEQLIAGVHEG